MMLSEEEWRKYECGRAMRDISIWGTAIAKKLSLASTGDYPTLHGLKLECKEFAHFLDDVVVKFADIVEDEFVKRIERYKYIMQNADWTP